MNSRGVNRETEVTAIVALSLFVTSFMVPIGGQTCSHSPLFYGVVYPVAVSAQRALGVVLNLILLLFVYLSSISILPSYRERGVSLYICAALLFANPYSFTLSPILPAALCVAWVPLYMIREHYFTAFFIISLASLFYPPLLWVAPIVFSLALIYSADATRQFLKMLGGLIVPFIILLSVRYLLNGDVAELMALFVGEMTALSFTLIDASIANLFLLAAIVVIALDAMVRIFLGFESGGIKEFYTLRFEAVNVICAGVLFFVFVGSGATQLSSIVVPAIAPLFAWHFSTSKSSYRVKTEWFILLCALVVARIGHFIG